jgi:putative ABC transport system permease protein
MDTLLHDVRYAFRMLRKAPGATAVAVLSLALGLSVNTTVFSWARSVILNPLPGVADADRIVTIESVTPSGEMIDASFPDYRDFRDRASLLDGVIAFKERPLGLGADARTERVWALMVSGNYFDVLGLRPALGRFFEGVERSDAFDAAPVAVLGHAMWRSRFGGDRSVVGRRIVLNRRPYTIVGVAPPGFAGTITGLRFDLYVPLTMQRTLTGGSQWLAVRSARPLYLFARLKPDVTLERARSEVEAIASALAKEQPASNRGISATLLTLAHARRGIQSNLGGVMRILLALAALVLLIVCANVANLQLARAGTREREFAIRLGLGAGRLRVLRQLLVEHLVLAAVACVAALLATVWLVDALRLFTPFIEYPLALAPEVGAREIEYAAGAAILAALFAGVWPAIRLSGASLADALKSGARQAGTHRAGRFRGALVVSQVALAMFALASAGLLARSFQNARRVDPGFDPSGVLLGGINLSTGGYDRDAGVAYLHRVLERTRTQPAVAAVTMAEDVPLGFSGGSWLDVDVPGYAPRANESLKVYRNLVAPDYFAAMRIPLVGGRDFTGRDDATAPMVAIVNEEFVRRYFAARPAVGAKFAASGVAYTIVGVVRTTKYHALSETPQPYVYLSLWQRFTANTGVALHVRTTGDPLGAAAALRGALQAIDPQMPPPLLVTMADYIDASYFVNRTAAALMAVLGALALALSSLGLYSLLAFSVASRRQELGVRVALGAAAGDIVRLVVGEGARMAAAGVGAGCVLAFAGTRALRSLLFGVSPVDASTIAVAAALLGLVALAASYVPARSAARTDPMAALRTE